MRRPPSLVLAATLVALVRPAAAQDDDWSVTRRPSHGAHPSHPRAHPPANPHAVRTRVPVVTAPVVPAPDPNARRTRMIAVLTESAVRNASESAAGLAPLLRLVRERDGSVDALVTAFESRAQGTPGDAHVQLVLGHLYAEVGRFDDALGAYGRAAEIDHDDAVPLLATAAVLHRMSRSADERAALERALAHESRRPAQSTILRQLRDGSIEAHDYASAERYQSRLVALDPASTTVRTEYADALLAAGAFEPAEHAYESLVRTLAGDNRILPRLLMALGRAHVGATHTDAAITAFRRALQVAGNDAGIRRELYDALTEVYRTRNELPAWITELSRDRSPALAPVLARLYEQSGNTAGAITEWQRVLRASPNDIDVHRSLAQLYRQQGMRAQEINEYRRLVQLAPANTDFTGSLVDLLVAEGHRDEALRIVAEASRRAGDDPGVHERLAAVFARHGDQQSALRELELQARLDPDSPGALAQLGRQQHELQRDDLARATWQRIRDHARDRARGAYELGRVYADNDLVPDAITAFREAVTLRPDAVEFHTALADALERHRDFDPAVAEWRQVIALARNDRELKRRAREVIVRLWGLQNRLGAQVVSLQRAFGATPPDLEAGRDLAEVLVRLHRADEAVPVLERLVALEPGDLPSLEVLERVQTQRGDLAGAIASLRRLVAADPAHARERYERMAQHALALHRDAEAIEFATRAVQLNDQDATAHLRLGELYRARGDMGPAIASLRRALELNERLFPTYFELADLHLGFGDAPREAVELYLHVVRLAPDDDYVARAGRRAIQLASVAGMTDAVEHELSVASAAHPERVVFRRLLVALYDLGARPLIDRTRHGTSEEARVAREQLAHLGARALAPLLDALADQDPSQQRIALDILGPLGNPNAAGALVTLAQTATDTMLRRRALVAAGSLGDPRVLSRLVAIAEGDDPSLATLATWSIAHVRTAEGARALLALTLPTREPDVRAMAALGLSRVHDPRAAATLRALLANERLDKVRAAAAYGLGAATDRETRAVLRAALETSAVPRLRCAAARALGAGVTEDTTVAALARTLFADDASLRSASAAALANLAVHGTDSTRSAAVSRAFDDGELASSVDRLLDALLATSVDADGGARALVQFGAEIARAAAEGVALGRSGPVLEALATPGALAPLATSDAVTHAEGGTRALGTVVDAVEPGLAALVTRPDAGVRRTVVAVLAGRDDAVARDALVRASADMDADVATVALGALATRTDELAVRNAIVAALGPERSWLVRVAAAGALARSDDDAAVGALCGTLRGDAYESVRAAAAGALAGHRARGDVARALSLAAREDAADAVRAAARAALERGATGSSAP